jgi:AcrR family transcriptional regulator
MSSAPRRGSYAKGRERREAILAAANELFAVQGFRGASLAAVAARVGLSEAGVLHHFPSKEHLLLELLDLRHERDAERVARAVAHHEALLDALLALCRDNQRSPGLVRLFTILAAESVDGDHPAHGWTAERYAGLRGVLAERLRAEQQAGRVAGELDPDLVAPQVLAMFDGLQLQWLLAPGEVDMSAVFADFLARLAPTPRSSPARPPA